MEQIILAMGIPSAIFGFFIWLLKRYIDKKDAEREKFPSGILSISVWIILSEPLNVSEVLTMREVSILWIHTNSSFVRASC